jgi:hypothetical protein
MADDPDSKPLNFTPVPVRARHDGWTVERQAAFLEALAETGCIEDACRHVGMSRNSAYRLQRREPAVAFRQAWAAALDHAVNRVDEGVLSRSIKGVSRPIFYKGEQVGEYREYDERLAMFVLRYRRPQKYGGWIDQAPCDPECEPEEDAAARLEWHLGELVELPPDGDDLAEGQSERFLPRE